MAAAGAGLGIRGKLPLVRLPMMPQVLVCLLDLYHRDDVSLGDVADIIRRDAGMSAKIMSVATSASQHGRNRPSSLDQCLSLLGMAALKKIVINESILQVFRRFTKDREFDLRRFWEHSLRSALIARELAKAMAYANHDEAYLGGLLHDVGQLAMLAADADSYLPLIAHSDDDEKLCRHEQEHYELTHAEVGAWLVEKWELDSLLSDGVLYHHDPVERVVGTHALIRIVFLANRLSLLRGKPPRPADDELARRCDAASVKLAPLLEKVEQELVELAEELGIELLAVSAGDADPDPEPGLPASYGTDILTDRVRDVLLVDNVLGDVVPSDSLESTLHHIAQAAKVLFKVNPVFYFLPQQKGSASYCAHPVGSRRAQVAQLTFVYGQSKSGVARAIDNGILSIASGSPDNELLDDQLLRLTGSAGLLLVPLRSKGECQGVMVAGFASALHANDLWARIPCFESFASIAGDLLRQGAVAATETLVPTNLGEDAGRERLRRVVHEIGNPLSIIQNYLSTLKTKYAENNIGTRELGIVTEEIGRLTKILHNALQDSGEEQSEVGAINLNRLIENLVALCRSSGFVAKTVDIQTELFAEPPQLWTDSDRLKQLLLNLLKNAVEAMPVGGGVIRVGTAPWGNGVGPTHIEIRIEDSGAGIPAEVLANLYQPVSSTKGQNHLGVGLAIVGQLVGDLHGLINCRSSDQGSSFQLLLPLGKQ